MCNGQFCLADIKRTTKGAFYEKQRKTVRSYAKHSNYRHCSGNWVFNGGL